MNRLAIAAVLLIALFSLGCTATKPTQPTQPNNQPLPTYSQLADRYNNNVQHLDRLWARIVVQVRSRDPDGNERRDQGEGHLQVERPARVAITLGKLGETYFQLGSDESRYWWFDLADKKNRTAIVGEHKLATPKKASEFGIPVHPLELMDLLGINPLPENGKVLGWDDQGRAIIEVPGMWGPRRLHVDPTTAKPTLIELLDANDNIAVSATLERSQMVDVKGAAMGLAYIPERYIIDLPDRNAEIRLKLNAPANRDINSIVFDFDKLTRIHRVSRVISIDAPPSGGESRP